MKRLPVILLTLIVTALTSACVERRLQIRATFEGKPVEVYLDGEYVGAAPTRVYFEKYGPRDWRARADGMETASGRIELEVPWYQWPVFDFFTEVLIPWTIVDEHELVIELRELGVRDLGELEERAERFRDEAIEEANKPKDIGDKRTLKPLPETLPEPKPVEGQE